MIRGVLGYRAATRPVTVALSNPYARRNVGVLAGQLAAETESYAVGAGAQAVVGGIASEHVTNSGPDIRDFVPIWATIRANKAMNAACPQ